MLRILLALGAAVLVAGAAGAYALGSAGVAAGAAESNANAAPAIEPRLDADVSAVGSFDEADVAAYEQTLLQPSRDRYDSGARAAGFSVKD